MPLGPNKNGSKYQVLDSSRCNCANNKMLEYEWFLTLSFSGQICNSPYCQLYNSYIVSSENLVLDQLIFYPQIDIFIYSRHLSG